MKKRFICLFLTLTILLIPTSVYANGYISTEDIDFEDEALSITHYDVATKTETIETVSISDLKAQNEIMKTNLGITDSNVLNGFTPIMNAEIATYEEGGVAPQTIFGEEVQQRVNVNLYPYSAVMFLAIGVDSDGDGIIEDWDGMTGFLVGYNVMVTAAHCFFTDAGGTRRIVDECRIIPLQSSSTYSTDPDDYYHPKTWTYATAYAQEYNADLDWLVATLHDPLGSEYGFFGVRDWSASIEGYEATVSGYPTNSAGTRYFQYKSTGNLTSISTKHISYRMDTDGGDSGSPVYILGNQVIGIHTGGGTENNWALRIFQALYTIIENKVLAGEELYG